MGQTEKEVRSHIVPENCQNHFSDLSSSLMGVNMFISKSSFFILHINGFVSICFVCTFCFRKDVIAKEFIKYDLFIS